MDDIAHIDIGDIGLEGIGDIDLGLFDLEGENYGAPTRYLKPKVYDVKASHVAYENAQALARDLDFSARDRYDVFVSGNFIFGDFIEAFLVRNNVKCLSMTISTLSLSQENVDSLETLMIKGYIDALQLVVSGYFYAHEARGLVQYMYRHLDIDNRFQLAVAAIHTKTCHFLTLGGKRIVIHGSANLRSSANIEQFTIEDNAELFDFYEQHYNALIDKCATINKPIPRGETWGVFTDKTTEQ